MISNPGLHPDCCSVQHSFWFLAGKCACSLRCSLCVLHFRLSLCVSGEADGQVPPVVKNIYSYTHSVTPTSPSCPASFHLRHRPLVPPGELSLSVHFTQDWCHSQSWNFQLSFVSFLWFHVHDDVRQILRYGEPKLAFGYFKMHLKTHELNYMDIKVTFIISFSTLHFSFD